MLRGAWLNSADIAQVAYYQTRLVRDEGQISEMVRQCGIETERREPDGRGGPPGRRRADGRAAQRTARRARDRCRPGLECCRDRSPSSDRADELPRAPAGPLENAAIQEEFATMLVAMVRDAGGPLFYRFTSPVNF
jgi:hypothetical protein